MASPVILLPWEMLKKDTVEKLKRVLEEEGIQADHRSTFAIGECLLSAFQLLTEASNQKGYTTKMIRNDKVKIDAKKC